MLRKWSFCVSRTMYLFKQYTRNMFKERGLEYPFVRCGRFPFPLQYYMEDKHEQNRFKWCIVCGKQVSRDKYRKGLVFDHKKGCDGKERCVLFSNTLMAKVQHDFPTYDAANRALPLSVCLTCQNRKLSRIANAKKGADKDPSDAFFRPKYLNPISDHDRAQYEHLLGSPHCGEGDENQNPNCALCTSTKLGPQAKKNSGTPPCDSPSNPPRDLPSVKRQLKPTDGRYKRNKTPSLTKKDYLFGRMETRSSAKGMVRFARGQRKRATAGDSPVTAPSTFELKRYYRLLNETFRSFFKTRECEHSPEGFAVLVKDVAEYVRAITHIMGKKVRLLFVLF